MFVKQVQTELESESGTPVVVAVIGAATRCLYAYLALSLSRVLMLSVAAFACNKKGKSSNRYMIFFILTLVYSVQRYIFQANQNAMERLTLNWRPVR